MASKKTGLGRGLGELFEQNQSEDGSSTVTLKISDIEPNRNQPRKDFDDEKIAELADSISKHGVLQPLLVRPLIGGGYQIAAGERRWRACRMAGLTEVPVVIREMTDSELMEIALIENLQREDLSPIEEALGYKSLMEAYNMTQDEVSKTVGKSRPVIANALRLLNLPDDIIEMIKSGALSPAQGRTLLSFKNPEDMRKAAELAAAQQITIRDMEKLAKKLNSRDDTDTKKSEEALFAKPFYKEVEISLGEYLARKVKVKAKSDGVGTLEIQFYNDDDLQEILKYFDK